MCRCAHFVSVVAVLLPAVLLAQSRARAADAAPLHQANAPSSTTMTVIPASVWEMGEDERIQRRESAVASHATGDHNGHEQIDGRQNPELFLRFELYDYLLWGISDDVKIQQAAHAKFDPKIRTFGYDVDKFWQQVRAAAEPYVDLRRLRDSQHRHTTLITSPGGKKVLVPVDRDVCAARITAMEQTGKAFGKRDFDRLLYSVIAPSMSHTSSSSSASDVAAQLRFMAGGCK